MTPELIQDIQQWGPTSPVAMLLASNVEQEMIHGVQMEADWTKIGNKHLLSAENGQISLLIGMGEAPGLEAYRKAIHSIISTARSLGMKEIAVMAGAHSEEVAFAMAESVVLSTYQFTKHKSKPAPVSLARIGIITPHEAAMQQGIVTAEVTCIARDLVNEPSNVLTATEMAHRAEKLGEKYGFSVEVLGKSRIKSLKMGGILAVNAGSVEPPSFSILEYKPKNPINERPVVLVGKGVVFDTGGLSLKPTANSMDFMKCDMAGAAAVIGTLCGAAALHLNVHVIGLIPATDNRPGVNAFAPSDIVTMFDGTKVEVLNTDAEGRMILGDALAYAKKYDPSLVIDLATLTGAAVVAVGQPGLTMMASAEDSVVTALDRAGAHAYERLVRLPLWDEYGDMIKSDIADIKNLGPSQAGAITAGKFLQHFTDYPWIHLDIAGPAWAATTDSYRGQGGTGTGVRLLLRFLQQEGQAVIA
ncbi:MAG: leucyl aminopeptidase [Bacteroidia bacterium]|nr:leucyl aminopeptidase [Bacteroidia bacterium]